MTTKAQYIDDSNALAELCQQLAHADWIAVDTEFLRERTYRPELCLIQLATPELAACVDPLAINIDPLLDVLYNSNITKVFHAAGQDLEIFYTLRGSVPTPLFDTQIAAPLLGHQEQMGYARLVEAVLGVELEKSHSRTDWSRRPLSAAQISYAADDVIYLAQLYPALRDELTRLGRLDWLAGEFAALADADRYDKPLEDLWQKIRGVERMKGATLAVIQALAAWREETARSANLPRNWLMKDDALVDIAKLKPANADELSQVRGISEGTRKRHEAALLALVREAVGQKPRPLPKQKRKAKLSNQEDALVDFLAAFVRLRADQHDINAGLLASRKELEQLVTDGSGPLCQPGWKRHLVGAELQELLAGKAGLLVHDGLLQVSAIADGG
jgi:ribonuclease D